MSQVKWNAFSIALLLGIACSVPLFTSCGDSGGLQYYDFADPIIVNIAGSGGGTAYLKIDLTLELSADNFDKVNKETVSSARIRHIVNELLSGKMGEELTPSKVADEIKTTVQGTITNFKIQNVLFRSFVQQ
jgi:flagellar basal body-associated protein FliL